MAGHPRCGAFAMAEAFLRLKRRSVYFPENVPNLHILSKKEISDDTYAVGDAAVELEDAVAAEAKELAARGGATPTATRVSLRAELAEKTQTLEFARAGLAQLQNKLQTTLTDLRSHRENMCKVEKDAELELQEFKTLHSHFHSLREDYTQSIESSKHVRKDHERSVRELRAQLGAETGLGESALGGPDEVMVLKKEFDAREKANAELGQKLKTAAMQFEFMQNFFKKKTVPGDPGSTLALQNKAVDFARTSSKQIESYKIQIRDEIEKKQKSVQERERHALQLVSLGEDLAKQQKLKTELESKSQELQKTLSVCKAKLDKLLERAAKLKSERDASSEGVDATVERRRTQERLVAQLEQSARAAQVQFEQCSSESRVFLLGKRTLSENTTRLRKKQRLLTTEAADLQAKVDAHQKRGGVEFEDQEKLDHFITLCRNLYSGKQALKKQVLEREAEVARKQAESERLHKRLKDLSDALKEQDVEYVRGGQVSKRASRLLKSGKRGMSNE